jgi:hypothetical protein
MRMGVKRSESVGLDVPHWRVRSIGLSDSELLAGCRSASPGVEYATYEMKVESWNMGTRINRPATEPG